MCKEEKNEKKGRGEISTSAGRPHGHHPEHLILAFLSHIHMESMMTEAKHSTNSHTITTAMLNVHGRRPYNGVTGVAELFHVTGLRRIYTCFDYYCLKSVARALGTNVMTRLDYALGGRCVALWQRMKGEQRPPGSGGRLRG